MKGDEGVILTRHKIDIGCRINAGLPILFKNHREEIRI